MTKSILPLNKKIESSTPKAESIQSFEKSMENNNRLNDKKAVELPETKKVKESNNSLQSEELLTPIIPKNQKKNYKQAFERESKGNEIKEQAGTQELNKAPASIIFGEPKNNANYPTNEPANTPTKAAKAASDLAETPKENEEKKLTFSEIGKKSSNSNLPEKSLPKSEKAMLGDKWSKIIDKISENSQDTEEKEEILDNPDNFEDSDGHETLFGKTKSKKSYSSKRGTDKYSILNKKHKTHTSRYRDTDESNYEDDNDNNNDFDFGKRASTHQIPQEDIEAYDDSDLFGDRSSKKSKRLSRADKHRRGKKYNYYDGTNDDANDFDDLESLFEKKQKKSSESENENNKNQKYFEEEIERKEEPFLFTKPNKHSNKKEKEFIEKTEILPKNENEESPFGQKPKILENQKTSENPKQNQNEFLEQIKKSEKEETKDKNEKLEKENVLISEISQEGKNPAEQVEKPENNEEQKLNKEQTNASRKVIQNVISSEVTSAQEFLHFNGKQKKSDYHSPSRYEKISKKNNGYEKEEDQDVMKDLEDSVEEDDNSLSSILTEIKKKMKNKKEKNDQKQKQDEDEEEIEIEKDNDNDNDNDNDSDNNFDEEIKEEKLEQENAKKEKKQKTIKELKESEEKERIVKEEKAEKERLAKEKEEKERKDEKERLTKEKEEKEKAEKAERERKEKEQKEKAEKERLEKERLENERLENERLENERLERERLENERLERERLQTERLEKEEILRQQQEEKERIAKEKAAKEDLKRQKFEKERKQEELAEMERLFNEEEKKKEKIQKQKELTRLPKLSDEEASEKLNERSHEKQRLKTKSILKKLLEKDKKSSETSDFDSDLDTDSDSDSDVDTISVFGKDSDSDLDLDLDADVDGDLDADLDLDLTEKQRQKRKKEDDGFIEKKQKGTAKKLRKTEKSNSEIQQPKKIEERKDPIEIPLPPHTVRGEFGIIQCEDGYLSNSSVSSVGCWKCSHQCHSLAQCVYPGICECFGNLLGDGVNSCTNPMPYVKGAKAFPFALGQTGMVNISLVYKVPLQEAFCKFNGRDVVKGSSLTNSAFSCVVPGFATPRNVEISFDGKTWEMQEIDVLPIFAQPEVKMVIGYVIIGIAFIIAFSMLICICKSICCCCSKKKKVKSMEELLPLSASQEKKGNLGGTPFEMVNDEDA